MQKKIESTEEIILEHIDNDKLIQTPNNETEEITNLDFDVRGNVYLCIFLAGVSKNKQNIFKTTIINNRIDFDDFITIEEDQKFFELLTTDPVIILKSIEYTIDTQMITVLEHIIDESTANYLDMHIKDDAIKKLIWTSNDNTNKLILRRLWGRYITLLQSTENFEDLQEEEKDSSIVSAESVDGSIMNKDHAELKNPKDLMPFSNLTKGLSDRGPGQSKTKDDSESAEFPLVKSRVTLKMEKMVSNSPKKTSAKIARMDFYSKFLEKSDIISIAIDLLGHEDVFELIHVLYDDLTEPIPSNYRLFKLLVQTEHMNLFELWLKKCLHPKRYSSYIFEDIKSKVQRQRSTILEKTNRSQRLDEEQEYMIKSKGNRYDVQEIVSDWFSNAIIMNKMHIAFYLYREYQNAVLGNVQLSIDSIIYAFKIDYQNNNKINNWEERFFILDKFLPYIDYKKAFELIETFKSLLYEEPEANFLTYSLNPLKIVIIMMSLIRQIKETYPLLNFQVDDLNKNLENVGNLIIRNSKSVEDVQDLLLDKLYNGIEIIDMAAYLNWIPILQNPVVDVIISNMYYGPYQRGSFLKDSMPVQVIQNEMSFFPGKDTTAASKMTIFAFRQGKRTKKKSKNVYEYDSDESDDSAQRLEIKANEASDKTKRVYLGHLFQFVVWKKSLDVKYTFNAVIAFMLAVIMQVYSVLLIRQIKDANSIDEQITETTANTTLGTKEKNQLLDQYADDLDASTAIYYEYITLLLVIHILTIAYLFQDFQEIIYSRLRGVYTKVISLSLILNILTSLLVLYWLYKYLYEYTVDLADIDSRRKVKTIIDRINGDRYFDLELSIAFLTSIQYGRMIFALQMSRTFGPMVKTLGKMLVDLSLFIFMYLLVFLIFTCASQLMFHTIDGYDSFVNCSLTLFGASLGDFDFSVFDNETNFTKNIGYIFLLTYLVVSTITLLNFLIAILSNTYTIIWENKNALYLREVVYLRQRYCYNPKYSSIVSAFVPLNIFALVMDPFIICLKSKKLNYACLLFEYIILALLSIVIFVAVSVFLLPISYAILILNKLKYWFKKPFFGKSDFLYRVLDLIVIVFIGFFWLLILLVWNTATYTFKLFSENIKLIEENEEEKIAHINALKDGSIDYSKFNQMYGEPVGGLNTQGDNQQRNPVNQSTTGANVGNPIKEGISLTTLKLLKMTLVIMRDDYLKKSKKEHTTIIQVPVELVIKEMYKHLCIQEHINQVCLGIHYEKDLSFFDSKRFKRIVDGFSFYEERETKIPIEHTSLKRIAKGIHMQSMIKKKNDIRALFWRNKLKNFLIKSDEKWILDQYNQIKRFCIDNSVEAVPTWYSIDNLKMIPNKSGGILKSQNSSIRTAAGSSKNYEYIEKRTGSGSVELKILEDDDITTSRRYRYSEPLRQKWTTIDICSLLDTFIEIEKNHEMRKILTAKTVDCDKLRYLGERSVINEEDEFDSFIEGTNIPKSFLIKQSSMINFKRNYDSLVEGLEDAD